MSGATVQTSARRSGHRPSWAAAAGLAPYLALAWAHRWVCDDAFISFRYARHLVEGLGLCFNAGESPAVEGYSNLLWILLLALCEALGLDLAAVSQVLSLAAGAALVVLTACWTQRRFQLDAAGTAVVSCFLATLPGTVIWATGGLETMAFALALTATCERLDARRVVAAALAAVCATWLRADGAAWVGAVVLAAWTARSTDLRRALCVAGVVFAAVGLQLVLRRVVHGDWLPNTAHAKVGLSALRLERGANYVVSLFLAQPALLVAVAVGLAAGWRAAARDVLGAFLVLTFALALSIAVGGDFMPYGRFVVPAMPFVALLLAAAWKRFQQRPAFAWSLAAATLAFSIAPFAGLEPAPATLRQRFHFRWNRADAVTELEQWRQMRERQEFWSRAAAAIARHTQPGESMVLDAVGALGYRTELELYDIFGLVSPQVARRGAPPTRASAGHDLRVEPEFFLDRRPDFIGATIAPASASEHAGLPPDWRTRPWAARLRVERAALDASDGFPPGSELRMFRLDWSE